MYQHCTYSWQCITHACVFLLVISSASASEPKPLLRIDHEDVDKIEIIGKLGVPLGKLVNIRGRWAEAEDRSKPSEPVFQVTHVDGKALSKPVEFGAVTPVDTSNPDFKKPLLNTKLDGAMWELRGHEMGHGVFGRSDEAMEEAGVQPAAMPAAFSIEFHYVSARKYASPESPRSKPSKPK